MKELTYKEKRWFGTNLIAQLIIYINRKGYHAALSF